MKRWIAVIVAVIALLALIGWKVSQKQAEAADRVTQKAARAKIPINVEAVAVTRRDVINTFEAVGTVEAPFTVDLKPEATGKVFNLIVREGDRVTAGQVIAQVDAPDLIGNVRRLEATAAQARARLTEAQLNTNPTNAGITTDIQKQVAAVATAQAQERQARDSANAQIAAAQSTVTDADGRIANAESSVAAAEAGIATAQSNLANAKVKRERQETLYKEGATAKQNLDDAATAEDASAGALKEALQRKEGAIAARDSANAQKNSALKNVEIIRSKAQSDIAVTAATVRQNQAGLVAVQANRSKTPAYQQNLEALDAVVRAADSDVRTARNRLNDAIIRSPMDGIVTRRYVDPGALVSPTQAVIAVQKLAQVWVTVPVPEEVSRTLKVGQQAEITLDALPGVHPNGHIIRIEPAADPTNRQFTVRIQLENNLGSYKPGTFARVALQTDRVPNALTVPREAIASTHIPGSTQDEQSVTVVGDDNTAQNRVVRTGITDGHYVVIADGVTEGEKVVILTGRPLKDGQIVKIGDKKGKEGKSGTSPSASGKNEPAK